MRVCDRVPYLDPSFEALVKIQLRFCAEAYSRMAQVQQYVLSSFSLASTPVPAPVILAAVVQSLLVVIGIWTHQHVINTLVEIWMRGWRMCWGRYGS